MRTFRETGTLVFAEATELKVIPYESSFVQIPYPPKSCAQNDGQVAITERVFEVQFRTVSSGQVLCRGIFCPTFCTSPSVIHLIDQIPCCFDRPAYAPMHHAS